MKNQIYKMRSPKDRIDKVSLGLIRSNHRKTYTSHLNGHQTHWLK